MGKLKEFVQGLWDGVQSVFITEADAFINDDDVLELAQYLKDMEYNIVGYGFVRPEDEDYPTYLDLETQGYSLMDTISGQRYGMVMTNADGSSYTYYYSRYYYNSNGDIVDNKNGELVTKWTKDDYGIKYWAEDGEKDGEAYYKGQISDLSLVDSSLLRMYLMADYRVTVLRNDDESWTNEMWTAISSTFGGSHNAWAKGLIKLYKVDDNGVGDFSELFWWDSAEIKDNGTKLSIRAEYFNQPMEFELDGWTGRYGLSLEFLLSLHLGTMAPDLVTAMVQCFDTEVQVYAEKVTNSKVLSKYIDYAIDTYEDEKNLDDEEVTIEDMNTILEDEEYILGIADGALIEWVNELTITKAKCQKLLMQTGLSSPSNCIYKAVDYVILHMQSHLNTKKFWEWGTGTYNYLKDDYGVVDPLLEEFEYRVKDNTEKEYNATNSLYSLRHDQELGTKVDPNLNEVATGLDSHVYPDRETTKNEAKKYGMTDSDIEEYNESKYTVGVNSSNITDNDEVIAKDNYVYRIERSIQNAEWTTYLDGTTHEPVDEATFNADTEGKYEETTAYYNSYLYKIYQVGYVDNDEILYYKDGNSNSKGTFICQFPYTATGTDNTSIQKIVSIYYNADIGSNSFVGNLVFYDENGDIITSPSGSTSPSYVANRNGTYSYFVVHSRNMTGFSDIHQIKITSNEGNITFSFTHDISARGYSNSTSLGSQTFLMSSITDNNVAITDEILYDVLYMNFVVRDKSLEELVACGLLEKDGDRYVPVEDAGKCSTDDQLTKCCTICQRYVKGVIRALAQVQDLDYAYYQPYIARVVGSWFRDTYFIIPEEPDYALIDYYGSAENVPIGAYGTGGSYVKVDEEYLASSGEYWTDYEMKKIRLDDDDGNPILDEDGNEQFVEIDEYQLYYLNPDGSTSDKTLEKWLEENVDENGNKYTSQEQAEADGYVFVKKAKMLSIKDVKDMAEGREGEYITPYTNMDTVWSAYTTGEGGPSNWIKINYGEIDNVDLVLDMVDKKGEFYYKLESTKSIEQEEDAIRTETNITVKNLFRYRQYYIYDGDEEKALAIEEDREKVTDLIIKYFNDSETDYTKEKAVDHLAEYGRYALREAYGKNTLTISTDTVQVAEAWLEYQLDMYYRAGNEDSLSDAEKERFKLDELCEYGMSHDYVDEEGNTVKFLDPEYYSLDNASLDPRNKELIATVNITKSSLDAFSILENVNTLDADYQYRDFKELIVELNYFDKEDLSETIEEVFTWLVPTYTSTWPILEIDKQNIDYGTLVHSQDSIDFLIEVYEKLVKEEQAAKLENGGDTTSITPDDNETSDDASESDVDMSKVYYIGDSWFVGLRDGRITDSPSDYFTAEVGAKAGDSIFSNIPVKSDAECIVIMLGLNGATTQTEMKSLLETLSLTYSDKNIYVLKVFHVGRNYTVMDKDTLNSTIDQYNEDIKAFCATKNNLKFVDATDGLIDDAGYLNPAYESDDGMHLTSYSKLYDNIKKAVEEGENGVAQTKNEIILEQLKEATAYVDGDSVISPVTGKIISYGEHERVNVYTQEIEKVGYVKIQLMSFGEESDPTKSYFTKAMLAGTGIADEDMDKAVDGLNSFYEEYKDQCSGYILMIDGIDISDLKNEFSGLTDEEGNTVKYEDLCQYRAEELTALYNSKEQKRREEEAEAKELAPSFIKYNPNYTELDGEYHAADGLGGYYVKEGAYLGKVQSATTRTGEKAVPNAGVQKENPDVPEEEAVTMQDLYDEFLEDKNPNYLRIIMLDTELTTVDNVEDYFPSEDTIDDLEFEKFLYWMGIHIEGGDLIEKNGTWYSKPVELNDGGGYTHFFGITSANNTSLAASLGYRELANEANWANEIELQTCLDMYLALIEEDKAYVRRNLGEDIPDGYLQAFISIKHNYGNLTKRGEEYKANGSVSESTWTTYENPDDQYAEALTNRRKGEWLLITEGIYPVSYGGNFNEIEFPSEDTPFTDWCLEHGITNIQVPED